MDPRPAAPQASGVTLADVAAAAGVARSTASLALRDDARVKAATKARVRAEAEALEYIRDPALSRLAHYRWEGKQRVRETLVYLTHYPDRRERYPWIYPAAEEESGMLGYALEPVELGDYPSARRLGDMLWHRSVRGILLAPILSGLAIPGLGWDRFSVVAFEEGHAEIPFHSVRPNYRTAVRICWERVVAAGARRPGLALLHEEQSPKIATIGGEFLFLQERNLATKQRLPILHGTLDEKEDLPERLGQWIETHQPDAILGINDAVYWALHDLGWFGDKAPSAYASVLCGEVEDNPAIPGTRFARHLLGETAVRLLDGLVQRGERGLPAYPLRHLIPPQWAGG